jgi:RNA polymerase sigma-54 factor
MQKLRQKQEQKQITSLQTIQLMSLLELPVNRLEELIERKLEENPALEITSDNEETTSNEVVTNDIDSQDNSIENENVSTQNDVSDVFDEEYLDDDYDFRYEHTQNNLSCFDKDKSVIDKISLQDNLLDQLNMFHLSEREKEIAQFIVGELEDDGYLKTDTATMIYDLQEKEQVQTNEQEVEQLIVSVIQSLDPAGVGARNLKECICLQIKRLPMNQAVQNALCIVEKYFEDFYKKHYEKLKNALSMSDEDLKAALDVIQHCDPHPTDNSTWLDEAAAQITPDFIVSTENDKIEIVLCHPQISKLHVNHSFKKEYHFIQNKKHLPQNNEAEAFLKKYVEDAELFIKLLSQREFTLLSILSVIVDKQSEYFLSGNEKYIKPLILKDVASELNIDISTVSRATHNKYIRSDFGVFPVKFLFSESIGSQDTSSREIKSILEELIQNERKNQPLTDDELVEALTLKGYKIARRTVAKYREQLHIPVARLRKEFNV